MTLPYDEQTGAAHYRLIKNKNCRSKTQIVLLRQFLCQAWGVNVTLKSNDCFDT